LFITRLGLFSLEPAVMENLEVNLSSLAVISRHVDKSHNQISQYLSKQCLAQLLLEKDYTLLIARHVRPLILDLLERNAERVQAGGQINHDLHERLCVALSRLLGISPDAQAALEESQQMEAEKALVLTNKRSVMWHQEVAQKFTRGQVVSEDLSQNVVAVCGVVLPRMVPRKAGQVCNAAS
ncbi:hypothetical protein XENOCAPTIV_007945, partial [Xenoophorus captivus]